MLSNGREFETGIFFLIFIVDIVESHFLQIITRHKQCGRIREESKSKVRDSESDMTNVEIAARSSLGMKFITGVHNLRPQATRTEGINLNTILV